MRHGSDAARLAPGSRKRIKEELKKRGIKVAAADAVAVAVAAAAADAAAAAAADAAAVADAAAAAVAVADAVADAAAVAVAVAVAVADAAAAADAAADAAAAAVADAVAKFGSDRYWKIRDAAYTAAKKAIQPVIEEKIKPTSEALFPSALELLDQLIDPSAAAAS
jgi:hypothetical protein